MKQSLCIVLFLLALVFTAFGQKLGKPTLTPSPLTATQQKTLQEGVDLHDAKKYTEAIAKYRSILAESPDCAAAMYELSMSLDSKGDKLEAVETAFRGSKYISDELPLFYVLIANNLDDLGKPDDAIKIYQDGLKALEGDTRFSSYRSSLYFNLGVTQIKLKKLSEARLSLKNAVESGCAVRRAEKLCFSGSAPLVLAAVPPSLNNRKSGGAATKDIETHGEA